MATDTVVGLREEERREVRDDPVDRCALALNRAANVMSRVIVRPFTSGSGTVGLSGA